ncbi:uncharacterized protein [Arachis hypogaea]|uniref:uncharacterized protein n=2 Tax=Arachis TaxID=3817 RepID=UPI003B21D29E
MPDVGTLRRDILKAHKSGFSIHPGSTKMYNDLKAMFWWPGMKNDVVEYVSKCLTCQKVKIQHQRPSRTLQSLEIPQWKWESIAMDFVSGLPRTRAGFDAVWYEAGEKSLLGPEMIAETTEQVKKIRDRMLTAQSHQKSYADQRRKFLEFEEEDHAFLKVTPAIGVGRVIKTKKLNPRYIGPFQILERVGPLAYRMALPLHLSNLYDLKEDLALPVTPVRIDDTSIKKLREKEVSLVKVAWSRAGVEEHTWEHESEMRTDYPHLFSGN